MVELGFWICCDMILSSPGMSLSQSSCLFSIKIITITRTNLFKFFSLLYFLLSFHFWFPLPLSWELMFCYRLFQGWLRYGKNVLFFFFCLFNENTKRSSSSSKAALNCALCVACLLLLPLLSLSPHSLTKQRQSKQKF